MARRLHAALLAALPALAMLPGCSVEERPFAQLAGVMLDARLGEVSGLAASRRHPDALWVLNDGGNPADLYAVGPRGGLLATLHVDGVDNTDWEDIAAFRSHGRDYLLVADVGDNGGLRHTLQLHVLEEPRTLGDASARPAWSIVFRWPDGPHNCEAVAVDAEAGRILLLTKQQQPPQVFELPLHPRSAGVLVARRIGELAGVPADEVAAARPRLARNQVTAADIAPDGHALAVLTYGDVLVYARRGKESWAAALARAPRVHPLGWLPQGEALGWAADGAGLYASGEVSPAPLLFLNP